MTPDSFRSRHNGPMTQPSSSLNHPPKLCAPRVSVIVAVFNAASTLTRCLESIAAQTYSDLELIVVDGASTDGSVSIIRSWSDEIAFWTSEPDDGIYDAWNKGLRHATGEWICFLGADDQFWSSSSVADVVAAIEHLDVVPRVVYGASHLIDGHGAIVRTLGRPWKVERRFFLQGVMQIPHPGLFHHSVIFVENGPFDPTYRIAGDYELLLRELKDNDALFLPNVTVAAIQEGGVSTDLSTRRQSLAEARRALRQHGITDDSWQWHWANAKLGILLLVRAVFGGVVTKAVLARFRRARERRGTMRS